MERKIVELLRAKAGFNQVCRDLRISKRRLQHVRALADEAGYLDLGNELPPYPAALFPTLVDRRQNRSSGAWEVLDSHRDWIRERLEAGWHAITVFEELPSKVPRSNFYRYLSRHKLGDVGRSRRRVVPEIVHEPGEALLVDWCHLWSIERDGKRQKVWAFLGVLGYSRFMVAKVMVCTDLDSSLSALREMYESIGGVPRRTTSDNPKVFALKADKFEPILNPAYERLGAHYKTTIECLMPRTPQHKGKVERPVPYVRRLLEAYDGDKADIAGVQLFLERKLVIANSRRHGTTQERPLDRFEHEEKAALKPLPFTPYETEHYHEGIVRIDGHVRFLGKYYSVEEKYAKQTVTILGNSSQVCIFHQGKLIETHPRLLDRNRSKSTKPHHMKPWEQACNNPEGLAGLGREIGSNAETIIGRILLRGDGFIDFRRIWGLLALRKKYPKAEIEAACALAVEIDCLSSRAIERFILEARSSKTPLAEEPSPQKEPGKFQRNLSEYSQLVLTLKQTGDTIEH